MSEKKIAIVGAGPAGCISAYFAGENSENNVTLFDFANPLKTLLPTGGGRCNLAHAEYDFRELTKFYPRGEKFMLSVFSKFSTADTLDFFEKIGVDTYTQSDLRIFPKSDSAKDVRNHILKAIDLCVIKREKVLNIAKENECFKLKTDKNSYSFDKVIIAVGGHAGYELAAGLEHKIIAPKPALIGLVAEKDYSMLKGVSVEAMAEVFLNDKSVYSGSGCVLFTHKGVSGPLIYEISSICARLDYSRKNPLKIKLSFVDSEFNLQNLLEKNSKKDIKNLIAEFVPKSFAEYILKTAKVDSTKKCYEIDKATRERVSELLEDFQINAILPFKDGEVVTSGGVCLDEINSKTMESKLVSGLYFCGEVIDVDGFCGGFNLQNCWSTGFIAGSSL